MYEKITSANVNMFAIKHYDNPHCESEDEFHDDLPSCPHALRQN